MKNFEDYRKGTTIRLDLTTRAILDRISREFQGNSSKAITFLIHQATPELVCRAKMKYHAQQLKYFSDQLESLQASRAIDPQQKLNQELDMEVQP